MAVEGIDFLDHASAQLGGASIDEIHLRNSISLAYYSVYHIALALADNVANPPVSERRGPSHKKLSGFFKKPVGIRDQLELSDDDKRFMKLIGGKLKFLHDQRVIADYLINRSLQLSVSKETLKRCRRVIDDLRELESRLELAEA